MLTKRQRDVLVFIQSYQKQEGGVSPSCDDIAAGIGIQSKGSVSRMVSGLEARGFIRRVPNRYRAIEVLKPVPGGKESPKSTGRIPIYDADTLQLRGYLPNV